LRGPTLATRWGSATGQRYQNRFSFPIQFLWSPTSSPFGKGMVHIAFHKPLAGSLDGGHAGVQDFSNLSIFSTLVGQE